MPADNVSKRKTPITEIGRTVPGNFKFGLIVAVALFWTDFVKEILNFLLSLLHINNTILTDFLIAVLVTLLAFTVLKSYRRIKIRLKRVKI